MTELEITNEAQTEESLFDSDGFTDDLSDEALDRESGRSCAGTGGAFSLTGG